MTLFSTWRNLSYGAFVDLSDTGSGSLEFFTSCPFSLQISPCTFLKASEIEPDIVVPTVV